jgi:hypothetical protein
MNNLPNEAIFQKLATKELERIGLNLIITRSLSIDNEPRLLQIKAELYSRGFRYSLTEDWIAKLPQEYDWGHTIN